MSKRKRLKLPNSAGKMFVQFMGLPAWLETTNHGEIAHIDIDCVCPTCCLKALEAINKEFDMNKNFPVGSIFLNS